MVDDTPIDKLWMDENPVICWHCDHAKKCPSKGMVQIPSVHYSLGTSLQVAFELVKKTKLVPDTKTGKMKRVSEETKNALFRPLVTTCAQNLPFRHAIADVWLASKENMIFIHTKLGKRFVMPIKANCNVALSLADKRSGKYVMVERLYTTRAKCRLRIYMEGRDFPLGFVRTVQTQNSHVFCSLWAFVRLELLHMTSHAPYETIKRRLYMNALKLSFSPLQMLDPFRWPTKPVFV